MRRKSYLWVIGIIIIITVPIVFYIINLDENEMKIEEIGSASASVQTNSTAFASSQYFDGYYFWATTPTTSSPSYSIYRNSTLLHTITSTCSAWMTTYGVMTPIFKIIGSTLYIVAPRYTTGEPNYYRADTYKYTAYDTYTTETNFAHMDYVRPIGIFIYDSEIKVPLIHYDSAVTSEWFLRLMNYVDTMSVGWEVPWVELDGFDVESAVGGWDDGAGTFYYVVSRNGGTHLDRMTAYGAGTSGVNTYPISSATLVAANSDTFQRLIKHKETWFFLDNNGNGVYRGKYDVQNSFARLITGTSVKYGTYFNTSNVLQIIGKLDGTNLSFYKIFDNGGIEKYNTTLASITNICGRSNYGLVYETSSTWYYRVSGFSTYTPLRNESLVNNLFDSPVYKKQQTSGTFFNSLILADDSNNIIFAGHIADVKDSTTMPLTELIYISNIFDDLKRKRSEAFISKTDGYILEDILDQGCVQLTTEGGSVTSGGSYDFVMNRMSVLEALRWLFNRTMKIPRWDGAGVVSFNTPTVDSGLDIDKDNIIGVLSIEKETNKYGSVILEGDNISVQSDVEGGGDGVYFDYYSYIDDEDELQAIADNIAEMQFNQYEKITVTVKATGLLNIGDYVDLVYNPHARINLNDQYYIMGYEYIPFTNNSKLKLSNAIYIETILDVDRQIDVNTQKINELDARTVGSTHSHSNLSILDAITSAGSGDIITTGERTAITHSNRTILNAITSAGSGDIITTAERTTFNAKMDDLSDDGSPQLGADLDSNGFVIKMKTVDFITFNGSNNYIYGVTDAELRLLSTTISFWAGGGNRADITSSGLRLGGGDARVNKIANEATGSSNNDIEILTSAAIQDTIEGYSYVNAAGAVAAIEAEADVVMATDNKICFRDTNHYIRSVAVDQLQIYGVKVSLYGGASDQLNVDTNGVQFGLGSERVTTINNSFVDVDTQIMTSKAIAAKIVDYGYTTNTGTVTGVTGTAPVVSSGGTAPAISMVAATNSVPGHLSAADHTTFDGKMDDLVDDSSPQLGGALECNNNVVAEELPTSDHKGEGLAHTFIAGQTVTHGHAVFINTTDGRVYMCSEAVSAAYPAVGVVIGGGTTGNPCYILLHGVIRDDSWSWSTSLWGRPVYPTGTTGTLSTTPPSTVGDQVQRVGVILDDDHILINPSLDVLTR